MKKHLRNLCTLLLLAVASMAWADETTITFSEQGYSNADEVTDVSGTDVTLTFDKGTNSNAPKYYTSGTAVRVYGGNTMTVSSDYTITKIEITFGGSDGSNAITTDVKTYNNGAWEGSAKSVTFTVGGTSGNRRFSAVKVTYTNSGTTGPVTPTITPPTFSPAAGAVLAGTKVTITSTTTEATIYYTTDGTEPTTNSTQGNTVTINEATTIKAIAVDGEGNKSEVATAEYTIKGDTPTPQYETVTLPYEEGLVNSQGKFIIEDVSLGELQAVWKTSSYGMTANGYNCKGDVESWFVSPLIDATEASSLSMTFEQNLRYFASTDVAKEQATLWVREGAEGSWIQLTIPEFENVNNNNFSSAGTIDLSEYAGKTIQLGFKYLAKTSNPGRWELKNLKVQAGEVVVLKDPELSFGESNYTATIGEENVFPVLKNPNNLTVSYRVSNENYATIDATSGEITLVAPGQTTVYAEFAGNDEYKEGVANYLLVVKEKAIEGTDKYELVTDASTLKADDEIIIVNIDNNRAISTTQNTNNRAATEVELNEEDNTITPSNQVAIIQLGGEQNAWTFYVTNGTKTGYLNPRTGNNNGLLTQADAVNAKITITDEGTSIVYNGNYARNVLQYNGNNTDIFACYGSASQTDVQIYRKVAETETVSISVNANFPGTTYSTDKALDFTNVEGLTAYIITDANGTTQQVTKVPANTGLYLEVAETAAEKREFEVPVTNEDVEAVEGNLLIPTDGTSVQSDNTTTYYAYGKQSGKYAFFKVSTTKAYTPSANKALLAVPTSEAGAKDMIDVNGGATGIEAIDNAQLANDKVYNLSGQRVAKAQKGVYIVNGRKVVVK